MTAKEREKQWLSVAKEISAAKGKINAALFAKIQKLMVEEEETNEEEYSPFD